MSLTVVVLLMAVLGAVLFAAAGFLFARSRAPALASAATPSYELQSPDAELERQLDELRVRLGEAQQETSTKAAELERCEKHAAKLQAEATRLNAEVSRLQGELMSVRATKTELSMKQPAALASPELPATVVSSDETALRAQILKAEARAAAAEQREKQVAADLAALRKGYEVAGNNLASRDTDYQRMQKDLTRVRGELEKACDEIAGLRLDRTRAEQTNAARLALEKEVKQLKAAQFAATASGSRPLKGMDIQLKSNSTSAGGALEDLVLRVQSQGKYESVAIADELGLTAAGIGPHTDELAAFTSLLLGVSARASRFFPMHDFGHATLTDAHGVSIEARPVAGTSGFVLLTLGAGNSAETP